MEGRWGGRPRGVRQGGRAGQGAPGGEERSTQLAKASLQEPGSSSHCLRQKETDGKGGGQRWGQGVREKRGVLTPRPPWAEPSLADAWSWSIRGGGAPGNPTAACPVLADFWGLGPSGRSQDRGCGICNPQAPGWRGRSWGAGPQGGFAPFLPTAHGVACLQRTLHCACCGPRKPPSLPGMGPGSALERSLESPPPALGLLKKAPRTSPLPDQLVSPILHTGRPRPREAGGGTGAGLTSYWGSRAESPGPVLATLPS